MKREQLTNGFIDCIHMLEWEQGGDGGHQRIVDGKVFRYSLKEWKDGYDELCDKNGVHITLGVFLDWINKEFLLTDVSVEESREAFKEELKRREECERKERLVREHRAAFANACDDLYYGYGYKFWIKTHRECFECEADAKVVWQAAFDKMAND